MKQFDKSPASFVRDLEHELDGAHVVEPSEIPPYLVTMNTRVKLVDTDTGKEHVFTLVFPVDEDKEEGRISILSDMGAAVFGYSVGDTIEWKFPDGIRHFRIDMIYFQPEATKQYDL